MTAANRSRLAFHRVSAKARQAQAKADRATSPHLRREYKELAAAYQLTADEWLSLLREAGETTDMGCDDCGAPEGDDCEDTCECTGCEGERAADSDADAYMDRCRD